MTLRRFLPALGAGLVVALSLGAAEEPTHQGKSLSGWLTALKAPDAGARRQANHQEDRGGGCRDARPAPRALPAAQIRQGGGNDEQPGTRT